MASLVLDTHAVAWYVLNPRQLSEAALSAIEASIASGDPVYLSAISIVELCYLVEKGRLPEEVLRRLKAALADAEAAFLVVPLDESISWAIREIPRNAIPDMPDRIIAATASHMKLPLVTRDGDIRAAGVKTIW